VAATGEECYYQKPILDYFDSSYDLIFDAHIEHYCARFDKSVVPARQCGTVCQGFEPLVGTPRTDQKTDEGGAQTAKSALIRKEIQRQLQDVCDRMRESAKSHAQRTEIRERRLRELDDWLGQPDMQPGVLGNDIAAAEQDIAKALAEQSRIQRHLDAIREGRANPRDVDLVRVEQEHWATTLKRAHEQKESAEELLRERERHEAAYERLYARWDGGDERLPLLMQLRWEVARCVRVRLANAEKPLSDADCDSMLRFLRDVSRYAVDDMPIVDLRAKVEELSQGDAGM
jgi:hypothetical protein